MARVKKFAVVSNGKVHAVVVGKPIQIREDVTLVPVPPGKLIKGLKQLAVFRGERPEEEEPENDMNASAASEAAEAAAEEEEDEDSEGEDGESEMF